MSDYDTFDDGLARFVDPVAVSGEPVQADPALRPRNLDEYVGQARAVENLRVYIRAAKGRGEAMDHVLLSGPPGLGKTSLAHIIAEELGVEVRPTSGPVIERGGDLAAILNSLGPREVLFIDEIHRLNRAVEEVLYPALEDFRIDVMLGQGPGAQSVSIDLPRFTLVGATTRAGLLTRPLRDRFPIQISMEFYEPDELADIVRRSAGRMGIDITDAAAADLARRSRGTPRVANRLLRRTRDFAEVEADGVVDPAVVKLTLGRLGIDSLATAIGEEGDTIEDVYEPFLIMRGFIQRTRAGRILTHSGRKHLGLPAVEGQLF